MPTPLHINAAATTVKLTATCLMSGMVDDVVWLVFLVFVLLIGPALLFERFSALLSSATLGLAVGGGLGLSWYLDLPSGICLSLTISAVSLLALRPNPGASVKL